MKNRGYNVEFKNHPGLGHNWKDEDIINFLERCLSQKTIDEAQPNQKNEKKQNSADSQKMLS